MQTAEYRPAPPSLPATADPESRRAAWLEERRRCITGTQISAILGLNHYIKPIDVWAEKKGIDLPFAETEAMRAGRRFERAILAETSERAERPIQLADPYELIPVAGFPLLGATLDAVWADTGAPVDAKNIRFRDASVWGDAAPTSSRTATSSSSTCR